MIGNMGLQKSPSLPLTISMLLLIGLVPSAFSQDTEASTNPFDHGTVNVILANRNGLVAATDSMLSSPGEHKATGIKLFKLDDWTVATMAGQYSLYYLDLLNFAVFVPDVMRHFKLSLPPGAPRDGFEPKVRRLTSTIEFELTNGLKGALLNHQFDLKKLQPLYITVSGYDLDGSLQTAQIAFLAVPERVYDNGPLTGAAAYRSFRRPLDNNAPACENSTKPLPDIADVAPFRTQHFSLRKLGSLFYCDVEGMPEVAEQILSQPLTHASIPAVGNYAHATAAKPLTLRQLKLLAISLVDETTKDQKLQKTLYVGGPVQIAVLARGRVQSFTEIHSGCLRLKGQELRLVAGRSLI